MLDGSRFVDAHAQTPARVMSPRPTSGRERRLCVVHHERERLRGAAIIESPEVHGRAPADAAPTSTATSPGARSLLGAANPVAQATVRLASASASGCVTKSACAARACAIRARGRSGRQSAFSPIWKQIGSGAATSAEHQQRSVSSMPRSTKAGFDSAGTICAVDGALTLVLLDGGLTPAWEPLLDEPTDDAVGGHPQQVIEMLEADRSSRAAR